MMVSPRLSIGNGIIGRIHTLTEVVPILPKEMRSLGPRFFEEMDRCRDMTSDVKIPMKVGVYGFRTYSQLSAGELNLYLSWRRKVSEGRRMPNCQTFSLLRMCELIDSEEEPNTVYREMLNLLHCGGVDADILNAVVDHVLLNDLDPRPLGGYSKFMTQINRDVFLCEEMAHMNGDFFTAIETVMELPDTIRDYGEDEISLFLQTLALYESDMVSNSGSGFSDEYGTHITMKRSAFLGFPCRRGHPTYAVDHTIYSSDREFVILISGLFRAVLSEYNKVHHLENVSCPSFITKSRKSIISEVVSGSIHIPEERHSVGYGILRIEKDGRVPDARGNIDLVYEKMNRSVAVTPEFFKGLMELKNSSDDGECVFVTTRTPTPMPEILSPEERRYYLYWKRNLLEGGFLPTDSGYIWLLVCELTNLWSVSDSVRILESVVKNYEPMADGIHASYIAADALFGFTVNSKNGVPECLSCMNLPCLVQASGFLEGKLPYSITVDVLRTILEDKCTFPLTREGAKIFDYVYRLALRQLEKDKDHPFSKIPTKSILVNTLGNIPQNFRTDTSLKIHVANLSKCGDLVRDIKDVCKTIEDRVSSPSERKLAKCNIRWLEVSDLIKDAISWNRNGSTIASGKGSDPDIGYVVDPNSVKTSIKAREALAWTYRDHADEVGYTPCEYVPSRVTVATYTTMSPSQHAYYTYWRTMADSGKFLKTDEGYVTLYVEELMKKDWRPIRIEEQLELLHGAYNERTIRDFIGSQAYVYAMFYGIPCGIEGTPKDYDIDVRLRDPVEFPFEPRHLPIITGRERQYKDPRMMCHLYNTVIIGLKEYLEKKDEKPIHEMFQTNTHLDFLSFNTILMPSKDPFVRYEYPDYGDKRYLGLFQDIEDAILYRLSGKKDSKGYIIMDPSWEVAIHPIVDAWNNARRDALLHTVKIDHDAVRKEKEDLKAVSEMMATEDDDTPEEETAVIETGNDPWGSFIDALDDICREYLKACISGDPMSVVRRSKKTQSVIENSINTISSDTVNDQIVEMGEIFEDYIEHIRGRLENP